MSETNLNVSITGSDAGAQAAIKALQTTVKGLESNLQQLNAIAANSSATVVASIQKEIEVTKAKIAVLREEIALKKQSSAEGIAASRAEANEINRSLDARVRQTRQRISAANAVALQERKIAEETARFEAQQINASLAAREAQTRARLATNNARVYAERAAEDKAAQVLAANARAEAEWINTNHNLRYSAMRREADLMNANFDLQARLTAKAGATQAGGGLASGLFQPRMARHVVAEFDSIASGRRGQAIATLGAAARDAGLGVGALSASMAGLAAVVGVGAILRGAEAMGKWAAESRAAASAAGMGLSAYSQLQGALVLTGMKASEADAALRRIAVNLSTAIADPASKAAEAFHVLGISQEDLVKTGGDVDQAVKLLADAFVKTADGANKSAAMSAIAGRGFETLIPVLQNGSQGLSGFEAEAKRLGMTLDEETAAKLEKAGQAVEHLGKTITGGGVQAFASWSPVIIAASQALEGMFNVLVKVAGAIGTVTSFVTNVAGYIPGKTYELGMRAAGNVDPASSDAADARRGRTSSMPKAAVAAMSKAGGAETVMDSIRNQMALAAASVSKGGNRQTELKAEIDALQKAMATEVLTDKQRETLSTELMNKTTQLNNEMASSGTKAAKQSYSDFASAEKLKIAEAEGSSTKIKAIYEEWISAAIGKYHQLMSVIDKLRAKELEAVNAAKRKEIMKGVSGSEHQNTLDTLNARIAALAGGTAPVRGQSLGPSGDIALSRQYTAEAQATASKIQTQISALKQYGATAEEVIGIETQGKQKELELYQKAAEAAQAATNKILAPWLKLFDSVGSQFESLSSTLLNSVIAPQVTLLKQGLTTIKVSGQGNEIGAALRKMLLDGIDKSASAVETSLNNMLANALSGGKANTISELLSQTLNRALGSLVGSIGSGLAGSAAKEGTNAVVTAIQESSSNIVTNVISSAATNAAEVVAAIAVNTANPEIFGFKAEGGAVIPSFAGGGMVGGGSLAILHAKEMVLPARISEGIQSMIQNQGRGGVNNNANLNYAPTINNGPRGRSGTGMTRAELAQVLGLHGGALLGEARNLIRSGWRPA